VGDIVLTCGEFAFTESDERDVTIPIAPTVVRVVGEAEEDCDCDRGDFGIGRGSGFGNEDVETRAGGGDGKTGGSNGT